MSVTFGSEDEMMQELRALFIAESADMIESLEDLVLRMEKNPSDEDIIREMFRLVHTIKGSSLSVGYHELGEFCHVLETLLDAVRKKKQEVTESVIESLLEGMDCLSSAIKALQKDMRVSGFEHFPPGKKESALEKLGGSRQLINPQLAEINKLPGQASQSPPRKETSVANILALLSDVTKQKTESQAASGRALSSMPYDYVNMQVQAEAFSQSDSALLAMFQDLSASFQSLTGLSESILACFKTHPRWAQISRVCVVRRFGDSSQLEVADSYCEDDLFRNSLEPGYRCFVSNASSLFSIPHRHLRRFNSVSLVADSYQAKGLPMQRSLRRLSLQGFLSGVCLPLYCGKKVRGFFYLNSKVSRFFEPLSPSDIFVLNGAALAAQGVALAVENFPSPVYEAENLNEHVFHQPFNSEAIARELQKALEEKLKSGVHVSFENTLKHQFWAPLKDLSYILKQGLEFLDLGIAHGDFYLAAQNHENKVMFSLSSKSEKNNVDALVNSSPSSADSNRIIPGIAPHLQTNWFEKEMTSLGFTPRHISRKALVFEFPLDRAFSHLKEMDYSV